MIEDQVPYDGEQSEQVVTKITQPIFELPSTTATPTFSDEYIASVFEYMKNWRESSRKVLDLFADTMKNITPDDPDDPSTRH